MLGAPLQLGALSVRLVRLWVNPALDTLLDSATPISYSSGKFQQSESIYGSFGPFLCASAESILYMLPIQNMLSYRRSQRH